MPSLAATPFPPNAISHSVTSSHESYSTSRATPYRSLQNAQKHRGRTSMQKFGLFFEEKENGGSTTINSASSEVEG